MSCSSTRANLNWATRLELQLKLELAFARAGLQATTENYVNCSLYAAQNYVKVYATFGSALKGHARLLSGLS